MSKIQCWGEWQMRWVTAGDVGIAPGRNYDCLPALGYVLVSGIAWRMLPRSFPSSKTVQRRPHVWRQRDTFRMAWAQLVQRYAACHGNTWDPILLDGAKKPAKKGGPDGAESRRSRAVRDGHAPRR